MDSIQTSPPPGSLLDLTGLVGDSSSLLLQPPLCTVTATPVLPHLGCICWCAGVSHQTEFPEGRNVVLSFYSQCLVHNRYLVDVCWIGECCLGIQNRGLLSLNYPWTKVPLKRKWFVASDWSPEMSVLLYISTISLPGKEK